MNEKRNRLEEELRNQYEIAHLRAIFWRIMAERLEDYVADATRISVIFELLQKLQMDPQKLDKFLEGLQQLPIKPGLRSAIDDYYGRTTPDPYSSLVPQGQPIVDRNEVRDNLRRLFFKQQDGSYFFQALVANGPRYSGRTHIIWLIQHITRNESMETVSVDLADNDLEAVILQIRSEMSIPADRFPDAAAQVSKQAKTFPYVLGGYLREQIRKTMGDSTRWCLVFDHYDRVTVQEDTRRFVDDLIEYSTNNKSLNLWVIVLGHSNSSTWVRSPSVLTVSIAPLDRIDVKNYLAQIAPYYTLAQLDTICNDIFAQLASPPLDLDGMQTMRSRLTPYIPS